MGINLSIIFSGEKSAIMDFLLNLKLLKDARVALDVFCDLDLYRYESILKKHRYAIFRLAQRAAGLIISAKKEILT